MRYSISEKIYNILVAFDQLGNAIIGDNADNTISARVGYFANHAKPGKFTGYWKGLEKIINYTFAPLDGPNHCDYAYHNDAGEDFISGGFIGLFFLNVLVYFFCILLFVIIRVLWILGIIRTRPNRRLIKMQYALRTSMRKFNSVEEELNEGVIPDEKLNEISAMLFKRLKDLHKRIAEGVPDK